MRAFRTTHILSVAFLLAVVLPISSVAIERKSASIHANQAYADFIFLPIIFKEAPHAQGCVPTPGLPPNDLDMEEYISVGLTSERVNTGLNPLITADELTQAARRHSRDMANNDFTSHTGSDGTSPDQRIEQACYTWSAWGEIIGWGFEGDPDLMINAWMDSPPHKELIISKNYEDFGIGYAQNPTSEWKHYWTVDFGKRGDLPSTTNITMYECTYSIHGEAGGSLLTIQSFTPCGNLESINNLLIACNDGAISPE